MIHITRRSSEGNLTAEPKIQRTNSNPNLRSGFVHKTEGMMKKLRKSIRIINPEADTVLGKPVAQEEDIPVDVLASVQASPFPRIAYLTKVIKKVTTGYMRSPTARLIVIMAAILSCVTYVSDTYATSGNRAYEGFSDAVDIASFVIFLVDYIFNLLFNATWRSKIEYIFSFQGLIDFASLFSILNMFLAQDLSFLALFRLTRVLKVMRVFRMTSIMLTVDEQMPPNALEAIYFDILTLILGILLAWFLFSSILYTMIQQDAESFEYANAPDGYNIQENIEFFDCVYIMLVIVATLGFGDFAPSNGWGRLFVIVVLLSALTIVPMKVGKLVETIGKNPEYIGNTFKLTHGNRRHIVLAANLTSVDFQKLINLILSEGSNDPDIIERAVPIALLSSIYPSPQLSLLLNHPMNARKVQFFVGDIKNQSDLVRVKASRAKAIIIFSESSGRRSSDLSDNIVQEDYPLKLKVVSLLNYLDQDVRKNYLEMMSSGIRDVSTTDSLDPTLKPHKPVVLCQTMSHEVCFSLLDRGVDRIISKNNIKYSMLAYGSMFPGFLSVVYSLTMPSNVYNKKKHVRESKYWIEGLNFEWGHGFELREVYEKDLSEGIKNLSFSQLCRLLYVWSDGNAVCVGVFNYLKGNNGGVLVNPERTVRIRDCQSIFVITNDYGMLRAMLKTRNLADVLRKLYDDRPRILMYDGTEARRRSYSRASAADVSAGEDSLAKLSSSVRMSRWRMSWADPCISSGEAAGDEDIELTLHTELEFKRGPFCFHIEVVKPSPNYGITSPVSEQGEAPPVDSPVLLADIVRSTQAKNVPQSTASSDFLFGPPQYPMGRGLSVVPEPSVLFGDDDGDDLDISRFLTPKRFSDHVVLLCAFQPSCALPRIVAAVETFVSATRSRSDEIIVVLSNRAEEIEARLRKKARNSCEHFDSKICFIYGLPNSTRHLRRVDLCFARSVVIVGDEYVGDDDEPTLDRAGAIEMSQVSVNSDFYILLAALEVEALLRLHIKHLQENRRSARIPIVIQELYSDSNSMLLSDSCTFFDGSLPDTCTKTDRDFKAADVFEASNQHNTYVSSALLQGRVFSAKMFDALAVQMLFNPHIVEFWEVVMGKNRISNLRRQRKKTPLETRLQQGLFDVLLVPEGFRGNYGALFDLLLASYGAIAIGLFRHGDKHHTHHVALMPHENAVVTPQDTVFVLLKGCADKPSKVFSKDETHS